MKSPSGPSGPSWTLDRFGASVCRLVLRASPPRFRRAFGSALVDCAARRADDIRRQAGTAAAGRYWLRQLTDITRAVGAEWIDRLRPLVTFRTSSSSSPEIPHMDNLRLDILFAFRTLARRPAVTAVIVITLALAIGANTAIFSIIDAVVLRPMPYDDPDRLVVLLDDFRAYDMTRAPLAPHEVRALRESTDRFVGFEGSTGLFQSPLTDEEGQPEQITLAALTPGYLAILGVRPALGRDFREEEGRALPAGAFADPTFGAPRNVTILSHGFWQRRFGGDPDVIGRVVEIGGREHEIVGVMPPDFRMLYVAGLTPDPAASFDALVPLEIDIANAESGPGFMQVVSRPRDGVSMEQAAEEVESLTARLRTEQERYQRNQIYTSVVPFGAEVSSHVRPALLALLGAVGFVLLIACGNVANLLLARTVDRRREVAIRTALGAGRGRIFRQSLTESVVLAAIGGALGLALASVGVRVALAAMPAALPRADLIAVNPTVALFTFGATLLAVLLFGTLPAVVLSGTDSGSLQDRGTGGGSIGRTRLRNSLVVLEVALSLVLLVGAGMTLRSFAAQRNVDLGFSAGQVSTFQVSLPPFQYQGAELQGAFLRTAISRLEDLPGVTAVGATTNLPLDGGRFVGTFRTDDMPEDAPRLEANLRGVSHGYFEALGVPLLSGRDLDVVEPDPNVVIIDQRFAESVFAGRDPLGATIHPVLPGAAGGATQSVPVRVVGIVGNVQNDTILGENRRTIYYPHALLPFGGFSFAVRTERVIPDLMARVRDEIATIDAELPIFNVRQMEGYIDDAVAPTRFLLILIGMFGGLALLLSAVGLYGVLAHTVRTQTRDIGVRMAFGATAMEVLREVVGRGAVLAAAGAALGLIVAVPLTRALRSLFAGIEPTHVPTLALSTVVLLAVSVLACYLPARRASRMDPADSLRTE